MGRTAAAALWIAIAATGLPTGLAAAPPAVPGARAVPYWASLSAGEARMRTGPARIYPSSWLYRRAGLPVQVVQVVPGWRKVRDPDGTEGWMIANLLSSERAAYVRTDGALHTGPDDASPAPWRVLAGVSAKLESCAGGWCRLDAGGRSGFIEAAKLWGVSPGETWP